MESLPKDVIGEIVLNLSPMDLMNFFSTSKYYNKFSNSTHFWRRKLERDYPEETFHSYYTEIPLEDPKQIYIDKFTFISKRIENFIEKFIEEFFPEGFENFLNKRYRNRLYFALHKVYENMKNYKDEVDDTLDALIVEILSPFISNNKDIVTPVRVFIENIIEIERVDLINKEMIKNLKIKLK